MLIVNRAELRAAAERAGINERSYCLDGAEPAERYVLELVEGGWSVYFSERGARNNEDFFETEDEACSELLIRLTRDPTTRMG
jgi:hypothetical protein